MRHLLPSFAAFAAAAALSGCATSPSASRPGVAAPAASAAATSAAPATTVAAAAGPTVIVVRHAERATGPAADPGLTAEGTARAEALAALLGGARVERSSYGVADPADATSCAPPAAHPAMTAPPQR